MASTVAESRPPDKSTTARALATLLPRHIAPQNLVELNLEAHRQAILENPVREVARGQLLVARRKQHGTPGIEAELAQLGATPLVVRTPTNNKLHQIVGRKPPELV